ncbi:MAG: ATP-binding protein [Deltaproteobacteria bacterium]|nr:ATP-binding protein [Deltaproteobacteria bacterium]
MRVAVASGKGGTGKTTVTASLARVWPAALTVADLDVEEPNLHLFLHPEITGRETAYMEVPVADEAACLACGQCAEICQFKAVNLLGEVLLVFPEMCHGCGGCLAVCPSGALTPGRRELGEVSWGVSGDTAFVMGRLRVGEAMTPPLLRAVMARLPGAAAGDLLLDAPPGVSCPAMTAVGGADLVLLVTEPTPFGLFDLSLAHRAFAPLGAPLAVVVNRAGLGDGRVYDYCAREGLPILAEIPFSREAAAAYAQGQVLAEAAPEFRELFTALAGRVRDLATASAAPAGEERAHG